MNTNKKIRIAVGQINSTVGDIKGNSLKMIDFIKKAETKKADIISFPELSITGYPPDDLLLNSNFIEENRAAINLLKKSAGKIVVVTGFAYKVKEFLYNSAAVIYQGEILDIYHKRYISDISFYNEKKYFGLGKKNSLYNISDFYFSVTINGDIFEKEDVFEKAHLIINIDATPYQCGKILKRRDKVAEKSLEKNISISYANFVGGQDELLFDGRSFITDNKGNIINQSEPFKEELLISDIPYKTQEEENSKFISVPHKVSLKKETLTYKKHIQPSIEEEIYSGLIMGLRDYVIKNRFKKVVIGLSGGLDSALVATIAVDSLGKEKVKGVFMPSRYTSTTSKEDVLQLVENLDIELLEISIEPIFQVYLESLRDILKEKKVDITEENIQARIRGNMLMAISNKLGYLVLITGNKSEMSVGYTTLYGDMAGGFGVIKDIYKTTAYKLAKYRNSTGKMIPERVITKPPTAELKYEQKDQDTLPPYEILDSVLKKYLEKDFSSEQILNLGFDGDIVKKIICMVEASEYKRKQSPPGIKITPKPFMQERRVPITNRYRS